MSVDEQTAQDGVFLPNNLLKGWTIHTVCIWQPWFQWVHKGWKNTAFHLKQSHLSLVDRQRSRYLDGVETEAKLHMCLAETLDHLSTVWHLVDVCPTVLLEDLKPNCTDRTWSSFQAFFIPDTSASAVVSCGHSFLQPLTNRDVVERSIQYGI